MNIALRDRVEGWTFETVEARLIEAWGYLLRLPDRERAWLSSGTMGLWRQAGTSEREAWANYRIDGADYHADAVRPSMGLTVAQVTRMDEALGWLDHVRPVDRKLVGHALRVRAAGYSAVPWEKIRRELRWDAAADTLRKRYGRALYRIGAALNAAEVHGKSEVNPL